MLDPKSFDYTEKAIDNSSRPDDSSNSCMFLIKLYTMSGEFVEQIKILPFIARMPEVITWGARTFILREDGNYYEGFQFIVLPREYTNNL